MDTAFNKTNVTSLQNRLKRAGCNPGMIDGDLGPKTYTAILNWIAGKDLGLRSTLLGRALAAELPKYSIETPIRLAQFLAQMGHETMSFRHLEELGSGRDANRDGFDDYLQRYDFREDLGNNRVGMGPKYRGRGLTHLTGYVSYVRYGRRIGIDLARYPDRAAEPEIAVTLACMFWADKGLNALADTGDTRRVTKKINGGDNGLADRIDRVAKLERLFS